MVQSLIVKTLVAFFSTTLDDLLALVYLFLDKSKDTSIAHPYFKIMVGQMIGFTMILFIVFLIGALLGAVVPVDYIDLIGFIPLVIGFIKLYESFQPEEEEESKPLDTDSKHDVESNPMQSESSTTEEGSSSASTTMKPFEIGEKSTSRSGQWTKVNSDEPNDDQETPAEEPTWYETKVMPLLKPIMDPVVLESAMLQFICGSDNISIYTSLFATESIGNILITVFVFYSLLFVNAFFAVTIVKFQSAVSFFQEYTKYGVAVLLIGLGLDILSESIISPWRASE